MKWNFKELTPGDEYQGIRDGDIEVFDKTRYQSVVREAVQNSLDARLDPKLPVRIAFRYFKIRKEKFLEIFKIEEHLRACMRWEKANDDDKELVGMMCDSIEKDEYTLLEIADYNTVGMEVNTSFDSFAHSRNVSIKTSPGSAGSKGMGKAAYFATSYLHTIFVSSIFHKTQEHLFQGISRISTHPLRNKLFNYKGYFSDDYNPVTDRVKIPDTFRRKEPGTSVFILGLWSQEDRQKIMEQELLNNFWLAILEGDLEVTIDKKVFDSTNVYEEIIRLYPDVYESGQYNTNPNPRPYIEAYLEKSCTHQIYTKTLKILGRVKFVIAKNNDYQGRIANFRMSKMLIHKDASKLYRGFCGVFICEDEEGNTLLKKLENATHTEWRAGNWKDPKARETLNELRDFQNECIKEFVGDQVGEELSIPEFDKLLQLPGFSKVSGKTDSEKGKEKEKPTPIKTEVKLSNNTPKTFLWLRNRAVKVEDTFKYIITMNSKKSNNHIGFEVFVGSDDKTAREKVNILNASLGEFSENRIKLKLSKGINTLELLLDDNLKHAIRLKEIKEKTYED